MIASLVMLLPALFLGALGIGFVSAIAGIGGGSLMVPYMILLLGYNVKVAIATSLICIIATSAASASVYLKSGLIDVKTALMLEPATAAGAIFGAYSTITLSTNVVEFSLGVLLIGTAVATVLKGIYVERRSKEIRVREGVNPSGLRKGSAITASSIAGLFSGMFGIGGGVLKVPIMNLILDIPIKTAAATSLFMIGLTASSGGIVYLIKGLPNAVSVAALVTGLIPGATLGARYMRRLKPQIVRAVFAALLAYAGFKLMFPFI